MTGGVFSVPDQSLPSRVIALTAASADVTALESTTSTSYVDLATVQRLALSPGVMQNHLLSYGAGRFWQAGASGAPWVSVSIAGAAALDADAFAHDTLSNSALPGARTKIANAVASGSSHAEKFRVEANTGNYQYRSFSAVAI